MKNEPKWSGVFVTLPGVDKAAHMWGSIDDPGGPDPMTHLKASAKVADEQVGKIVGYLRSTGQLDDTLVVLTADHGSVPGRHFHGVDADGQGYYNWYYGTMENDEYKEPQTALQPLVDTGNLAMSYSDSMVRAWLKRPVPGEGEAGRRRDGRDAGCLGRVEAARSALRPRQPVRWDRMPSQGERHWFKAHAQELLDTTAAKYGADVIATLVDDTTYSVAGDHGGIQRRSQQIPIVFAGGGVGSQDLQRRGQVGRHHADDPEGDADPAHPPSRRKGLRSCRPGEPGGPGTGLSSPDDSMSPVTAPDEEEQPALLPAPARAKAVARKAKPPKEKKPVPVAAESTRWRGCWSTSRWPTSTGPSTTPCRRRWPRTRSRGCGSRCGSPARTSTASSIERAATTDHTGRLQPLRRVVSAEQVLAPDVTALTGAVAERYAGTRSDVLRLAVPPRHATVEKQDREPAPPVEAAALPAAAADYTGGPELLTTLSEGGSPRAVWTVLPGDDWADLLTEAVVATAASGRGALVCVPDHRDVERLDAALTERLGQDRHVVLAADAGPARRYRAFLKVSRGAVRIVIGTRAAAFAPVRDLGLVAMWDDGDDLFDEPRAPYPHAREVLLMRAHETGCAARARRARPQRRGGVPPPHGLGHRGGCSSRRRPRADRGGRDRRRRPRPRARPGRAGRHGSRVRPLQLLRDAVQAGPGAGPDAPGRLRDPARLRPLPDTGHLRCLPRAAAGARPRPTRRSAPGARRRTQPGPVRPECGAEGSGLRCSATPGRPRRSAGRCRASPSASPPRASA